MNRIMDYDEWYAQNEDTINIELAESGADREMDFNPELEFEKRYIKYCEAQSVKNCNMPCVSISCRHDYNYKILFDHTAVAVCLKCKKRVKA